MLQSRHPAWSIREETAADYDAIRDVNRFACKRESEARLVDQLRADGDVVASLVAVESDQVVGHIMFSKLPIEMDGDVLRGTALAPMAVKPNLQRQGIGSALVNGESRSAGSAGMQSSWCSATPSITRGLASPRSEPKDCEAPTPEGR